MRKYVNEVGLIAVLGIICYFSLSTGSSVVSSGSSFIPMHGVAYFVLAAGFLVNFHDTTKGHFEAVLLAFLFGVLMEFMQTQVPGRVFSLRDMGMNLLGASIVLLDHRVRIVSEFVTLEDRMIEAMLRKTGL